MTSMHPVCLSDQSCPDHHPLDLAHATLCKNFAQSKEFNGMLVKQYLCWYVCMYTDGQVDNTVLPLILWAAGGMTICLTMLV